MTPKLAIRRTVAPCATPKTSLPLHNLQCPLKAGNCYSMTAAADRIHGFLHTMPTRRVADCPLWMHVRLPSQSQRLPHQRCPFTPQMLIVGKLSQQCLCLRSALIGCWLALTPPQHALCIRFIMQKGILWGLQIALVPYSAIHVKT